MANTDPNWMNKNRARVTSNSCFYPISFESLDQYVLWNLEKLLAVCSEGILDNRGSKFSSKHQL